VLSRRTFQLRVSLLAIALISVFAASAQQPGIVSQAARGKPSAAQAARNALHSEAAQRGASQFAKSCGFCHGKDATGGAEGPNLMRSSVVRHDNNGDLIGKNIREGRPNGRMPPIPLAPQQISDIVAYLHAAVAVSDRTSAGRPSHDYSLKRLLTGNAAAGKSYFNGAGGCSQCHSPTGDLAGIAKKYPPVELQARFLYPAGKPQTATVKLASGETVTGKLVHLDAFYVAIEDEKGWYRSWPCKEVKVEVHNPIAAHVGLLSKYTNKDMHNLFAYLETLK
jgi:cytochrome c oxidase cbb3-type subunit III